MRLERQSVQINTQADITHREISISDERHIVEGIRMDTIALLVKGKKVVVKQIIWPLSSKIWKSSTLAGFSVSGRCLQFKLLMIHE